MTRSTVARRRLPTMAWDAGTDETLTMGADWPLLRSLSEEDRRRVLSAARRRRFARREVLFHEGDPGDTLHLIDKGRGDVVGEMAVLEEGGRRGATVMALEAAETLSVDRGQFLELRRRYPGIDLFIFDVLMANIRRVNVQLMEALFVPVDRRVVRRLLSLAEIYAARDQVDDVEVALTQDDLASLAGTSRATVNRVLRQAEEAVAVSLSRGRIRVVDRTMLSKRAR